MQKRTTGTKSQGCGTESQGLQKYTEMERIICKKQVIHGNVIYFLSSVILILVLVCLFCFVLFLVGRIITLFFLLIQIFFY